MAKGIITSGMSAPGGFTGTAAGTFYIPPGYEVSLAQTTFAWMADVWRGSTATLSNLTVQISTNTRTVAQSIGTFIGSAAGNLSVSVGAGATGLFQDTTHTDSLADGTQWSFLFNQVAGSGAFTPSAISCVADSGASTLKLPLMSNIYNSGGGTAGTTYSVRFGASPRTTPTLVPAEDNKAVVAGSLSNLYCYVSTNTAGAAVPVILEKNGADSALQISITAATTGGFEDTTDTVAIAAGDTFGLRYQYQTVAQARHASVRMAATTQTQAQLSTGGTAANTAPAAGTTTWRPLCGIGCTSTMPTTAYGSAAPCAGKLDLLTAVVPTNTTTGASTLASYNVSSSAAGNQSVSVGAGATGAFQDSAHNDTPTAGQIWGIQQVTGAGGACYAYTDVRFDTAAGVPQHLAASPAAVATSTAALDLRHHLAAAMAALATFSATLETQKQLAATMAAQATATAALETQKPLAANAAAQATSTGALDLKKHLSAAISAVATATAMLDLHKDLGATLVDVVTSSGSLDIRKHLAATATAIASMTAALESNSSAPSQKDLAAAMAATASMTAALDVEHHLGVAAQAVATAMATARVQKHLGANAQAQATVTAALERRIDLAAAAQAVADAQSVLRRIAQIVVDFQAQSTLTLATMEKAVHLGAVMQAGDPSAPQFTLEAAPVVPPVKPAVRNVERPWQAIVSRADPSQADANRRELEYPFSRRKFYGDTARRGPYH